MRAFTGLIITGVLVAISASAQVRKADTEAPAQASKTRSVKASKEKAQAAQREREKEVQDALFRQTLEKSYTLARSLNGRAKVSMLSSQCSLASEAGLEDLQEQWCEELFRAAQDELPAESRAQPQSVAARSMASADPDRALELLRTIDAGDSGSEFRGGTARLIFEAALAKKGLEVYPKLREVAGALGDAGAYPYVAVGGVCEKAKQKPELCDEMLQQALDYFRQRKTTSTGVGDFGFAALLRNVRDSKQASDWLIHEAAAELGRAVTSRIDAAVQSGDPTDVNRARMLYGPAHRVIDDIDPQLARVLAKRYEPVQKLNSGRKQLDARESRRQMLANDAELGSYRDVVVKASEQLGKVRNSDAPEVRTEQTRESISSGVRALEKFAARAAEVDEDGNMQLYRYRSGMQGFVSTAVKVWPEAVLEQIETVQSLELKANLTLEVAQALRRSRRWEARRSERVEMVGGSGRVLVTR